MKKYIKNDVEKAIQNLTLQQFLKGATDLKAQMDAAVKTIDGDVIDEDQKLNKRQVKSQMKDEQIQEKSQIINFEIKVPLKINYDKILFEEKKQIILQFARIRLCKFTSSGGITDSPEYLMFKAIVENCDRNITCTKNQFYNIGKFNFSEVLIACEENGIKFDGEKTGSAKVLENL